MSQASTSHVRLGSTPEGNVEGVAFLQERMHLFTGLAALFAGGFYLMATLTFSAVFGLAVLEIDLGSRHVA